MKKFAFSCALLAVAACDAPKTHAAPIAAKPPATNTKPAVKAPAKAQPKPGAKPGTAPAVKPPATIPLPYVPMLAAPTLEAPLSKLANGVVFTSRPDRLAPRVAISLLFKAGAADETTKNAGWRRLLGDAMLRGTLKANGSALDTRALRRAAEALGGQAGATVGDDAIEFWAIGHSATQGELLDLLLQMALTPRLAEADVEASRDRLLRRLDAESNDVPSQAINALRDRLYRDESGAPLAYGLPDNGLEASLKALDVAALRRLHAAYFQPERMVAAFAGDVDGATLRARLEAIKAPSKESAPSAVPHFAATAKEQPPLVVRQLPMNTPLPTAWLFAGYQMPGQNSADLPAVRVLCAALGEMPRSRLERRLLGAKLIPGLEEDSVFQAASQWTPRRFAGEMVVFAQTRADDIEDAKNALLDEVNRMRDVPLTATELERAKNYLRGVWAVDREGLRDRSYHTAAPLVAGADPKFSDTQWPLQLQKVTAADVRRVAQKYLKNYAVTLIMPED
jgi:zinc protease